MIDGHLYDAFMSYGPEVTQIALQTAERLRRDGVRLWFDRWELAGADDDDAATVHGMENARVMVVMLNNAQATADLPQYERSVAWFSETLHPVRQIILVKLARFDAPHELMNARHIDWHIDPEQGYLELLAAIRAVWAFQVATRFMLSSTPEVHNFREKGNINLHTYLTLAKINGHTEEFLLQRVNPRVFLQPRRVMDAMIASSQTQRSYLEQHPLPDNERWETIELVQTREGAPYLELIDGHGTSYWRLMRKIPHVLTYKSLSELPELDQRLQLAHEAGRGLAMYSDFTSQMDTTDLQPSLPGYRDTRLYLTQLDSVLQGNRTIEEATPLLPVDPMLRHSTEQLFLVHISETDYKARRSDRQLAPYLQLVQEHRTFALSLQEALKEGRIRTVAIHGDTKLDNFLFDIETRRVRALIDLDTIMPHTWLADWGDMIRSLVNVAGEKETDLSKVDVDMAVFEAVATGFLQTAREVTPAEVRMMVDAPQIIAYELGTRFLTDYLRGDNYFRLAPGDPPDLNKVRAMVQLTLFQRMRDRQDMMQQVINRLTASN